MHGFWQEKDMTKNQKTMYSIVYQQYTQQTEKQRKTALNRRRECVTDFAAVFPCQDSIILTFIRAADDTFLTSPKQRTDKERQRMTREQMAERQARHIARSIALDEDTTEKYVSTFCECKKEVWALRPDRKGKRQAERSERKIAGAARRAAPAILLVPEI